MSGILMAVIHNYVSLVQVVVSPSSANVTGSRFNASCYAGVEFQTGGDEFATASSGLPSFSVDLGAWLDEGESKNAWVLWHRTGGSLADWNDLDEGEDVRLRLNTTRRWRIVRVTAGQDTIIGYFEFWDRATGGTLLHTSSDRTFDATRSDI